MTTTWSTTWTSTSSSWKKIPMRLMATSTLPTPWTRLPWQQLHQPFVPLGRDMMSQSRLTCPAYSRDEKIYEPKKLERAASPTVTRRRPIRIALKEFIESQRGLQKAIILLTLELKSSSKRTRRCLVRDQLRKIIFQKTSRRRMLEDWLLAAH